MVLIKPIAPDLAKGPVLLIKGQDLYKRGVVQEYSPADEHKMRGIMPGDVVYYPKAVLSTEHGDYVDIENLLCLEVTR